MAHCDWYKRAMGMQGSGPRAPLERAIASIWTAKGRGPNSALVLVAVGLMPALAACSSSSSSSSPTASAPATYQPASAPVTTGATAANDSTAPYPSKSLVDVFTEDAQAAAPKTTGAASAAPPTTYAPQRPGMPHPPGTYTASAPPYQGAQPGYDAYAGAQPRPAPVAAQEDEQTEVPGYASKSLLNVFSK